MKKIVQILRNVMKTTSTKTNDNFGMMAIVNEYILCLNHSFT